MVRVVSVSWNPQLTSLLRWGNLSAWGKLICTYLHETNPMPSLMTKSNCSSYPLINLTCLVFQAEYKEGKREKARGLLTYYCFSYKKTGRYFIRSEEERPIRNCC